MMDRTATQPPLELTTFNNQSLFSDHYLRDVLRATAVWRDAIHPGREFLGWLRDLYAREQAQLPHYKEAQLEDNWLRPIFGRLGHVWEGQAAIPGLKGNISKPDYAFFPDEAARKTAVSLQNTPAYAQTLLAVGEVKQWEVNLSKKTGSQPTFDAQNPMYQIDTYLTLSGVDWGVLSNGRSWRLLHKNSSRTLETYFEIDLLAALHAPNETFAEAVAAYFWLFFNQAAFQPAADGRTFLDEALAQSRAYALALEADLRDNAYRALEQLIIGFFAGDNSLNPHDPADRAAVYRGSLYLLYRLLFLFYGESRALLPIHNPFYRDNYALQTLAQSIDSQRNQLTNLPTTGQRHWHYLRELFRLISGQDEQLNADLGVPRYNGGLFDPAQHPFLEQHFVGDRALAQAIDYLATRRIIEAGGKPAYQAVDYRTLDVRQLGSVYEGLLEYRVAVATEEMVTISQKGVETWVPLAQKGKAKSYGERRQPGELYLTTDKGERKATGSYYTPDYIVEYIVANTLGPLVEQVRADVRASSSSSSSRSSSDLFIEGILALNILDPAMGSGHFLVEATHYLARALATDEYVQAGAAESDLLYWKRRIVEACIYGVDKNPMAVELAKLSLWLKTAVSDKPLSFLDHHLQCGDSLVGARLADLVKPPGGGRGAGERVSRGAEEQMALFDEGAFAQDMFRAVGGVMRIERLPTLDIETVHAKEAAWRDIQQTHVARWRQLADLWTSAYFGNGMTPEEYRALADRLQGRESLLSEAQAERFLRHPAVTDNDYFHWELAFPEVFYDEYGRRRGEAAGFDAVIGNPPYVRQEQLTPLKPFFSQHFPDVYAGTADLFVYFFMQALNLLRQEGVTSYISSNSWLRANYATNLRAYLRQNATIETLIDLGDNRVFADAPDLYPAIHIVRHAAPQDDSVAQAAAFNRGEGLENFGQRLAAKLQSVTIHNQADSGWQLDDIERTVFEKIMRLGQPLGNVVNGQIYFGIKTGLNEAFILDLATYSSLVQKDTESKAMIKPILRGANLRPWHQAFQNEYLIVLPNGWTKNQFGPMLNEEMAWQRLTNKYPAIAEHLSLFADKARKRQDQGEYWWELRPCDYYHIFDNPKILWPDIAKFPRFSWETGGFYPEATTFCAPSEDAFLVGILQSRVIWFCISKLCHHLGERAGMMRYRLKTQYMVNLPIPDSTTQRNSINKISMLFTNLSRQRYQLHQQIRHRILTDLGTPDGKLNLALTAWWELDFPAFRAELKKAFKRDIPLKERHDWELYLADGRRQHQQLTTQIITLETELNQHVYALFHLTPEEIQIIETSTKYNYGEV